MRDLPARPELEQLRRQAKDLLRAARAGDADALAALSAVSERITLASAQLAVAREYGFAAWPALKREVERREILDDRDVGRLTALLAEDPLAAATVMEHWSDHPRGASPLGYVAMLRYDTASGDWRDLPGTAAVARSLIEAGAPVDGEPGDRETPLITAASYGDAGVARVLIEAGADVEARSSEDSGGVPGGTALLHAAVFGMTGVVDVLVEAGAEINSIEEAAAAGDVGDRLASAPADARLRALVMAADHQRLDVIDQLVAAGVPVDETDEAFDGHPLRTAAGNARPDSVRRLLAHGADPNLRDDDGRTPLDLCGLGRHGDDRPERDEVEAILVPLTPPSSTPTAGVREWARPLTPPEEDPPMPTTQFAVCRFKIKKSADQDAFEKAVAAAVSAQKKAGSTRMGQLAGHRFLRGNTTGNDRAYVLELDGLMSLPAGIKKAIETASAGAIAADSFIKVGGR
jgi:ankyrin repeat protein